MGMIKNPTKHGNLANAIPQLSSSRIERPNFASPHVGAHRTSIGGPGRIRTYVGISRQIYSLLPLAAWVPTHKSQSLSA